MLSTAAVLGSGCDADLLRAVSGRGEAETVEALDEAVARFLLIELPAAGGSGAPCYDFPYEALRRVAYESASLARRRLLHGRAADALAARYERDPISARAAVIAGHLQRAGREAEAAGWWWRAAARARELYAHAEAHAHLRQALALGYPQVPGSIAVGDVLNGQTWNRYSYVYNNPLTLTDPSGFAGVDGIFRFIILGSQKTRRTVSDNSCGNCDFAHVCGRPFFVRRDVCGASRDQLRTFGTAMGFNRNVRI